MSIGRVVRHFEGSGKVPVDINDVLALVRELVPTLKIKVRGVNVDPSKLRGTCYRYAIDDAKILLPQQVAYIVYSRQMEPEWQRLVCCKELVHILEPDPIWTSTKEKVLHLAERVIRPLDVTPAGLNPNSIGAVFDQLAKWHAMAILFPFGLWEEALPLVKKGKVTAEQVADWVELPVDHVAFVLSDEWKAVRETLLAFT
jgi:hypothetical protein